MKTTIITKTLFIAASPETVFAFLVEKDKLGEWYHRGENDLAPGQDYTLLDKDGGRAVWGRVLSMTAPSNLVTTFNITPFGGAETTVTWHLEVAAGGTRLTLSHDGIAEAAGEAALDMLRALDKGWDTHLGRLREALI